MANKSFKSPVKFGENIFISRSILHFYEWQINRVNVLKLSKFTGGLLKILILHPLLPEKVATKRQKGYWLKALAGFAKYRIQMNLHF